MGEEGAGECVVPQWLAERGTAHNKTPPPFAAAAAASAHFHTPPTLTSAPMTPRLVRRRYSKGRVLLMVLRKGYRNRGMWAAGGQGGGEGRGQAGQGG